MFSSQKLNFFGVPRIVIKSAPGGTIWTISGDRLENARFEPQIQFLSGVPRIVLKCAPGGTIWTISGEHLENRVFKPKNSKRFAGALGCFLQVLKGLFGYFLEGFLDVFRLLEGVLRIVLKSAPGGTIWTISGERLENARFQPQIQFLSGVPRVEQNKAE